MRTFLAILSLAIALSGARLGAQQLDNPITVPITYYGTAVGTASPASFTFGTGLGAASNGSTSAVGQWFNSTTVTSYIYPGKTYNVTVSSTNCAVVVVNFPRIPGYDVYINGKQTAGYSAGSGNYSFQVRIEALNDLTQNLAGRRGGECSSFPDDKPIWYIGLGSLRNGKFAGAVGFRMDSILNNQSSLYNTSSLIYDTVDSNEVSVTRDASGYITQIQSRDVVLKMTPYNQNGTSYTISVYQPTNLTSAFITYTVSKYLDANGTGVRIDKSETDSLVTHTSSTVLNQTSTGWIKYDWRSNFDTTNPVTTTVSGSTSVVQYGTVDEGGSNQLTLTKTYTTVNGHKELASEQWGTLPATVYTYNSLGGAYSGELLSKVDSSGNWVSYTYYSGSSDPRCGLIMYKLQPWLDAPASPGAASVSNCRAETYDYATNYDGTVSAPASRVVAVNGTTVGKTTWSYNWSYTTVNSHVVSQTTESDYSSSTNYLNTITLAYRPDDTDSFFRNKLHAVSRPNGTKDSYAYYSGTWNATTHTFSPSTTGNDYLAVVLHGQSSPGTGTTQVTSWSVGTTPWPVDSIYLVANLSTISETVIDTNGHAVFSAEDIYTGGSSMERISGTATTYNGNNLPGVVQDIIRSVPGGDVSVTYDYSAGSLVSKTDVDGTKTSWAYDNYLRISDITTSSGASGSYPATTQSFTYYSANLKHTGFESPHSAVKTTYAYDTAGRVTSASVPNPGGGTLSTGYTYPTRVQTVATLPTLATRQTDFYLDGRVKDTLGSGQVASYVDYSVDLSTGNILKTTRHDSDKSNGWLEETTDWLGRTIKSRTPEYGWTPSSPSLVLRKDYSYNSTTGQLSSVITTDEAIGVKALPDHDYVYGNLGMLAKEGDDIGNNGQLDAASADRIILYNSYFYKDSQSGGANGWIRVDQKQVYRTLNSSSDITTVSQTNTRYTGFNWGQLLGTARVLSDVTTINASGRWANEWVYADAGAHSVTHSVSVGGLSNYAYKVYQDGYLKSEQSASGVTRTYAYDASGRLYTVTEGTTNAQVTNQYWSGTDYLSSVTRTTGPSTTSALSYAYSVKTATNSSVTAVTDAAGNISYTESNALGLRWRSWGGASQPTLFDYDPYGRRKSVTTWQTGDSNNPQAIAIWLANAWPSNPGVGNTVTWDLDAASGLAYDKTFPDSSKVQFTYNARGQMKTRTWARGLVTTYNYFDTLGSQTGELQSIVYADSGVTPGVSYTYTRTGNLSTVTDAAGTRTIAYGSDLNPSSEAYDNTFFASKTLTWSYDSIGRSTGYSFNGSVSVGQSIGYDGASGRVNAYQGTYGTTNVSFTPTYAAGTDWVSGVTSGSYSRSMPLVGKNDVLSSATTSWGGATLGSFTANYGDVRGWRNGQTAASGSWTSALVLSGALQSVYTFDGYGQLVSSTGSIGGTQSPAHTFNWTYDCAGNRKTESGAVSTTYQANSLNQYSSITGSPLGEGNPSYDADGNLKSDATWTYGYDCENRLISMNGSGKTLYFKYDYLGRRIEKTVSGVSDTKYVWSGWTLVAELSSDGSTVRRSFVYGRDFTDAQGSAGGAGALLAQIDNGTVTYAMPDALGNIAGYVSSTGTMAAAVEYSPYGRPISTTSSSSNYPVGYAGQYTDWETGLVYYGYRYYMPKHGRFINRDPSEEQGGYNLYAFCLNGPTGSWDTLGLWDQNGNPSNAAEGFQLWVQRGGAILNGASPATPDPTATDDFIQAWHGLQTTLSTPDAVIRGYTITQDYTAGTVTHTDDFGRSVMVRTAPKASDNTGSDPREGQTMRGGNGTDTWTMTWHNHGSAGPAWYNDELEAPNSDYTAIAGGAGVGLEHPSGHFFTGVRAPDGTYQILDYGAANRPAYDYANALVKWKSTTSIVTLNGDSEYQAWLKSGGYASYSSPISQAQAAAGIDMMHQLVAASPTYSGLLVVPDALNCVTASYQVMDAMKVNSPMATWRSFQENIPFVPYPGGLQSGANGPPPGVPNGALLYLSMTKGWTPTSFVNVGGGG